MGLHKMKILASWIACLRASMLTKLSSKAKLKSGTFDNCEVTCAIWEEIFEDIDDALKDLKATDDLIKSDLTRLSIENVEQNKRLQTVEEKAELLSAENKVLKSSLELLEGRLDQLVENGTGSPEEIVEIENSLTELGEQIEAQSVQIEELSADIETQGDNIE